MAGELGILAACFVTLLVAYLRLGRTVRIHVRTNEGLIKINKTVMAVNKELAELLASRVQVGTETELTPQALDRLSELLEHEQDLPADSLSNGRQMADLLRAGSVDSDAAIGAYLMVILDSVLGINDAFEQKMIPGQSGAAIIEALMAAVIELTAFARIPGTGGPG